jgi:hypothetical protein
VTRIPHRLRRPVWIAFLVFASVLLFVLAGQILTHLLLVISVAGLAYILGRRHGKRGGVRRPRSRSTGQGAKQPSAAGTPAKQASARP